MKALIISDMQKIITKHKDFSQTISHIDKIVKEFRDKKDLIVFTKQISHNKDDFFYLEYETTNIDYQVMANDIVIEKQSPSAFKDTNLDEVLRKNHIEEVTLVGFNTEFCCLFTTIAAFDRGYRVTFVEDAIGSCNDENAYEMPGLDINDFVGTVLDWSSVISVIYTEEL